MEIDEMEEQETAAEEIQEGQEVQEQAEEETSLEEQLQEKLEEAQRAVLEAQEMKLRNLAEMENYKKRLQREKDEQAAYAAEKVLRDLLPTLDNFELALQYGSQDAACKAMFEGLQMTRNMLLDVLKKHGMIAVGSEGEPFDPNDHEAVGQESSEDAQPGSILRVLQKGYRLGGRLVRPARVIVAAK